jgi:hypothetical protein
MNVVKLDTVRYLLLASGALLAGNASAALTGTQTATMNFTGIPQAVFGWANEANTGSFSGSCQNDVCFVQNGIVAGVVKDPIDKAHLHGSTRPSPSTSPSTNAAVQYHPDGTGLYVRLSDLTKFSLTSLNLYTSPGATGGNFVIYGFMNPLNPGLLSDAGSYSEGVAGDLKFNPTDPEGGNAIHKVSFTTANDGTDKVFNFTKIPGWDRIGAFWITMQGFNHSPTKSYPSSGKIVTEDEESGEEITIPVFDYAKWDARIDQIVLGAPAPVPVPGAVWLFGTGLIGLIARNRKKRA